MFGGLSIREIIILIGMVVGGGILIFFFLYWFFGLIKIALIDPLIAKISNKPIVDKDPDDIISEKQSSLIKRVLNFLGEIGNI